MTDDREATIRPRRDEDLDALARVLVEVHERDGYPVEGVADPHAWLTLSNPLGAWVAELNGKVVGHVALTEPGPHDDAPRMWAEQTGLSIERTAVLGRLFVSPQARGHQIGEQLTHIATNTARTAARQAVLDVMTKDTSAVALYKRLGWQQFGKFSHNYGGVYAEPAVAYRAPSSDDTLPHEEVAPPMFREEKR